MVPVALTLLFLAFIALPRIHSNPKLVWAFLGTGAVLLVWTAALFFRGKKARERFGIDLVPPVKSHYIQASVQLCVYAYWGWYWREVYAEIPLLVAQLVFLYAFDALLTWSRGRHWRLGFGPLPIILSTNVFIWFKDDWFAYQFAMVALGAVGKEFLKWTRDGRRTHIFNPSAFTLGVFSIVLILTETTGNTWAGRIASTIDRPPHIYLLIFFLGLIVQHYFAVTLVTLTAAATLCLCNLLYTWNTGTYWFVFSNLPVPIFLGFHLLVTDPSTSPRTHTGKVIFGTLYGFSSFALSGLLDHYGAPTVYDKLLPIPFLNLSVQWMDRIARNGFGGAFLRWETLLPPRRLNVIVMACWASLFITMRASGYVGVPHEGSTAEFWKKAIAEGRPNAGKGLIQVYEYHARENSPTAWNELGVIYIEGKLIEKDPARAARCFARASNLGDVAGSANLATMFLGAEGAKTTRDVAHAFELLERACAQETNAAFYYLVGRAYDTGRGRPLDKARAKDLFRQGCARGNADACNAL